MICNEVGWFSGAPLSPICDHYFFFCRDSCIIFHRNHISNSAIEMLHSLWYWSQDMRSNCLFKHISVGWNAYRQGTWADFFSWSALSHYSACCGDETEKRWQKHDFYLWLCLLLVITLAVFFLFFFQKWERCCFGKQIFDTLYWCAKK